MPFASAKQEAWLRANHPDIAARWTSEFGTFKGSQNFRPSKASSSNESPNPKVAKLPRLNAQARDFGGLKPSAKARHTYSTPAREQDSMSEKGVQYVLGSKGKLGLPQEHVGFRGRDGRVAAARGK